MDDSAYLSTNYNTILTTLNTAKTAMVTFADNFDDTRDLIYSAMRKLQDVTMIVMKVTQAFSSLYIIFSFIGVIGLVAVMVFKNINFRYILYMAWLIFGFLSVLTWSLSIFSYTSSVVIYEMCDSMDKFSGNSDISAKMTNLFESSEMQDCLFGDGDLVASFQLTDTLAKISELTLDFENIDDIEYLFSVDTTNMYSDQWLNELNEYKNYEKEGVEISSADGF